MFSELYSRGRSLEIKQYEYRDIASETVHEEMNGVIN